jgi:hypothetical protein
MTQFQPLLMCTLHDGKRMGGHLLSRYALKAAVQAIGVAVCIIIIAVCAV